jgi:hypothetical protein
MVLIEVGIPSFILATVWPRRLRAITVTAELTLVEVRVITGMLKMLTLTVLF